MVIIRIVVLIGIFFLIQDLVGLSSASGLEEISVDHQPDKRNIRIWSHSPRNKPAIPSDDFSSGNLGFNLLSALFSYL